MPRDQRPPGPRVGSSPAGWGRAWVSAGGGKVSVVIAVSSLLLVVAMSLVVTRVATVVLTATGLSRHAARFQARSAFTGAGFTTSESEKVVDHPLRRRVIMTLMLLGNAGIVASAGSLILGFRGGASGGQQWVRILELVVGLLGLVLLSRSQRVDRWLTGAIGRLLRRFGDLPQRDLGSLLQLSGSYAVQELAVSPDDWLAERTLGQLALRDEGVAVLGVTRGDGRYLGAPGGGTHLHVGDILVVYGSEENLRDLDSRPAGPAGDDLHRRAVTRQDAAEDEEGRQDALAPPPR